MLRDPQQEASRDQITSTCLVVGSADSLPTVGPKVRLAFDPATTSVRRATGAKGYTPWVHWTTLSGSYDPQCRPEHIVLDVKVLSRVRHERRGGKPHRQTVRRDPY